MTPEYPEDIRYLVAEWDLPKRVYSFFSIRLRASVPRPGDIKMKVITENSVSLYMTGWWIVFCGRLPVNHFESAGSPWCSGSRAGACNDRGRRDTLLRSFPRSRERLRYAAGRFLMETGEGRTRSRTRSLRVPRRRTIELPRPVHR